MLGGHSTLNTVVLGEGISKYQIPSHFGHHSSEASLRSRVIYRGFERKADRVLVYKIIVVPNLH
jgi:hypothetical protein